MTFTQSSLGYKLTGRLSKSGRKLALVSRVHCLTAKQHCSEKALWRGKCSLMRAAVEREVNWLFPCMECLSCAHQLRAQVEFGVLSKMYLPLLTYLASRVFCLFVSVCVSMCVCLCLCTRGGRLYLYSW